MYKDLYVYNTWNINREHHLQHVQVSGRKSRVPRPSWLGAQWPARLRPPWGQFGAQRFGAFQSHGGTQQMEKWMVYDGKSHEHILKWIIWGYTHDFGNLYFNAKQCIWRVLEIGRDLQMQIIRRHQPGRKSAMLPPYGSQNFSWCCGAVQVTKNYPLVN